MTGPAWHTGQAPLAPGDRVWLIAPSGPAPEGTVEPAIAYLEDWGLDVEAGTHLRSVDKRASYLAGSDAERLADLVEAWTDPEAAAVIAFRGGFGAMRLIDSLNFDTLTAAAHRPDGRPKLLTGSSDITALHQAWAHHLRVPTLFSPMVGNDVFRSSERIRTDVHRWLFTPWADQPVSLGEHAETLVAGEHTGITYGGNLSLLAAGLGSPEFDPGTPDEPGILILEDLERTHISTVRHPSCFTAANRRAPQTRVPSVVIVGGCSSPSLAMDAARASISPRSVRCRCPIMIEATARWSWMCPWACPISDTLHGAGRPGRA